MDNLVNQFGNIGIADNTPPDPEKLRNLGPDLSAKILHHIIQHEQTKIDRQERIINDLVERRDTLINRIERIQQEDNNTEVELNILAEAHNEVDDLNIRINQRTLILNQMEEVIQRQIRWQARTIHALEEYLPQHD